MVFRCKVVPFFYKVVTVESILHDHVKSYVHCKAPARAFVTFSSLSPNHFIEKHAQRVKARHQATGEA